MRVMWTKIKQFPLPHNFRSRATFNVKFDARTHGTIFDISRCVPKTDPKTVNSNPEHFSFEEKESPDCYADSTVNHIHTMISLHLSKHALETDKIHALRIGFMPIFTSFKEDLEVEDDITGQTIKALLHLTPTDSTLSTAPTTGVDRIKEPGSGDDVTHGGKILYQQNFDYNDYYDTLHYSTISKKLQKCQGGLNWLTLSRQHPTRNIMIKQRSKTKYMNKYTYFGVLLVLPTAGQWWQLPLDNEVTTTSQASRSTTGHVIARVTTRFDEWNTEFDTSRFG